MKLVDQVQFHPDQAIKWGISFLGNGAGNMMNTTVSAVGSIVSGVATFFIAFSFSCYILFQKEKLHIQIRKVFFAFLPKEKAEAFLRICSLTYRMIRFIFSVNNSNCDTIRREKTYPRKLRRRTLIKIIGIFLSKSLWIAFSLTAFGR